MLSYCHKDIFGFFLIVIMPCRVFFTLFFIFWVTLPSAVHLLICAQTNGGNQQQKRELVIFSVLWYIYLWILVNVILFWKLWRSSFFCRETCNESYLLLCNVYGLKKKCRLFLDKNNLCEVMEVCPVLYILSLSCLDNKQLKKKVL